MRVSTHWCQGLSKDFAIGEAKRRIHANTIGEEVEKGGEMRGKASRKPRKKGDRKKEKWDGGRNPSRLDQVNIMQ